VIVKMASIKGVKIDLLFRNILVRANREAEHEVIQATLLGIAIYSNLQARSITVLVQVHKPLVVQMRRRSPLNIQTA
jgi:hypothetical protein